MNNSKIINAAIKKSVHRYSNMEYVLPDEILYLCNEIMDIREKFRFTSDSNVERICAKYLYYGDRIPYNTNISAYALETLYNNNSTRLIAIDIIRIYMDGCQKKIMGLSEPIDNIIAMLVSRYIPTRNPYIKTYITYTFGNTIADKAYKYIGKVGDNLPNPKIGLAKELSFNGMKSLVPMYWVSDSDKIDVDEIEVVSCFPSLLLEYVPKNFTFIHSIDFDMGEMPSIHIINKNQLPEGIYEISIFDREELSKLVVKQKVITTPINIDSIFKLFDEYSAKAYSILYDGYSPNFTDKAITTLVRDYIFVEIYQKLANSKKYTISPKMTKDLIIQFDK